MEVLVNGDKVDWNGDKIFDEIENGIEILTKNLLKQDGMNAIIAKIK